MGTTYSEVFFKITPEMNGDKLICKVKEGFPGLNLDSDFKQNGSKTDIILSIDYPPRDTQIIVVDEKTNSTYSKLKCETNSNPKSDFSWFMNGDLLDSENEYFD